MFFDYDSVRDGVFNQAIYEAIENCRVFVAFLSKDCLTRCANEGDWVRLELERALREGKKIVPIAETETLRHWQWPENLPECLAPLKNIQISELHTGCFFDASMDMLVRERFPPTKACKARIRATDPLREEGNNERPRIGMSGPKVSPISFPQTLAKHLNEWLPRQDFRLVEGLEFRDSDGKVRMMGHVVGSPWGVFLIGCQDGADIESVVETESLMREFADAIVARCEIIPPKLVHCLFAIPEESSNPLHPDWVVVSAAGVLSQLKKCEKEVRVLDWEGFRRDITQGLESFPMTRWGREENILKHFRAKTPEELEDGAKLLSKVDDPSEKLLDAAEKACMHLREPLRESVKAWFLVMANRGNVLAMDHYGWMLGESQVRERAEWFRRAADLGSAHAQNSLGWCLHEGWGIERDRDEALRLFRASAAQGNRFGQASLARAYAEPDFAGLPQDPSEAFRLWRLSAEQDLPEAQFRLGQCFEEGFGTIPDMNAARRWYEKAATWGHEEAKSALRRLAQ